MSKVFKPLHGLATVVRYCKELRWQFLKMSSICFLTLVTVDYDDLESCLIFIRFCDEILKRLKESLAWWGVFSSEEEHDVLSLSTPFFNRYLFIVARLFDFTLRSVYFSLCCALRLDRFILLLGDFWFLISYKIVSEQLDDVRVVFNVKLHFQIDI